MRSQCRIKPSLPPVFFALGGALLVHTAGAATLCTGLPLSTLQVYDIKAPAPEETSVTKTELDRDIRPEDLVSRHPRMLSVTNFVAWFAIEHRMVPRDDGSVCDAPTLVRVGFGASRRLAFFVREVAKDPRMRQCMRDHEADHTDMFNDIVDRFIDQNRGLFQRGMIALKETPAPDAEVARARWELGMRQILGEAKQQLLAEIRAANARIDASPLVEDLEKACGEVR
jgi:hypothetical protein